MTSNNRAEGYASLGGGAAGVHRYWYPLMALVRRDVKKRYATTMFGVAWTILQPVILLVIYIVVFGFIFQYGRPAEGARAFVFYLLTGMLPYLAIAEAIHRAGAALREDRALLDREVFPAEVVPAARVITASVGEAVGLVLLVVLGPMFGMPLTGWICTLPLLMALRLLMTCGLTWIVSILAIFVADLNEVLSLMLTAWLFLTPIFYTVDAAPPVLRRIMLLNPLYHVVQAYRHVLLEGRAPFPDGLFALAWAVALAGAGLWFFRKTLDRAKDFL